MRRVRSWMDRRTRIGQARLVGLAGVTLASTSLLLSLVFMGVFASGVVHSPSAGDTTGRLGEIVAIHAFLALLTLVGVLMSGWPTISALVLFVAFAGSFVWGFGWYLLLTLSPLALAGLGGVLYLIAAIMMAAAALGGSPRRAAG